MERKGHNYRHRILVLLGLIVIAFLVIEIRLWSLQIWLGDYYRMRADEMRRTMETIGAPRGRILDRKGSILVEDAASFDIYADVTAENVDMSLLNLSALLAQGGIKHPRLSALLLKRGRGESKSAGKSADDTSWRRKSALIPVAYSVGYDMMEKVAVRQTEFPGIVIKLDSRRIYPEGETACHVLGYLGPMRKGEPKLLIPHGYRMNDSLGRSGVELKSEENLRGKRGGRVVERDFKRGGEKILLEVPARNGRDEKLTIDLRLQKVAEEALGQRPSAAVVMNVQSGDILVMVSRPGYDPSVFASPRNNKEVKALLADERKPMLNRAIQGGYPLGSIYKLITAVAGIETGKITDETHYECYGSYRLGRRTFRCWRGSGHGSVNLGSAIEGSCNVFFYKSAESIGGNALSLWGKNFGFGAKTGIDIPYEKAGRVPSPSSRRSRPWTGGDTLNLGIGQGDLVVTPLQVARCVAAIANGGWLVKPRVMVSTAPSRTRVNVKPDTLEEIRHGMWMVVNSPIGTGKRARLRNVEIAGKTATAQVERLPDHAWFTAFAPYDKPQISIVVFVEYGGKGGRVAAPIAAKILKAYFE